MTNRHIPKAFTFGGILVVALFIVAASFWYKQVRTEERSHMIETSSQTKITPHSLSKKTDAYTVTVEYPHIPETVEGGESANEYFKQYFASTSREFVRDVEESLAGNDLPEDLKKGMTSYYTVSSEVVASTSRYLSFLVSDERYYIGSAHPSHNRTIFIFDKKNKKLVEPASLFKNNSSYVEFLSKESISYFDTKNKSSSQDDVRIDTSSNDGLTPTIANFSKMLPTEKGLMVYFDEYQIAPYVAGPQEALIPYTALTSVINKDGVLGEYAK
jgi:hypothetical protein